LDGTGTVPTRGSEYSLSILRIRDVRYIPDPDSNFFHPGSRVKKIPRSGYATKNLSILTQKIVSQQSRNYDPESSSRFFTHPGSRGQKRHRIPDPDPQHSIYELLRVKSMLSCIF
jgi:hypothetical protein